MSPSRCTARRVSVLALAATLVAAHAGAQAGAPTDSARMAAVTDSIRLAERADPPRPSATVDTIKPKGDTTRTLVRNSTLLSPIPLYSPESGWGGGAGFVFVRIPEGASPTQRPSNYQGSIVGTETGQFTVQTIIDMWTKGNQRRYTIDATYQRNPSKFFGIGPVADNPPEKYTPTSVRLILTAQQRIAPKLFTGVRLFVEQTQISDVKPGPIASGTVPGSKGWNLATLSWLLSYDTRDRYYSPRSGVFATLQVTRGDNAIGSEFNFWRTLADIRWYRALVGEHILAVQLWGDANYGGTTAFDRMPRLGGKDNLRGFFGARYRDKYAVAVQAEYRSAPWRRFSGTVFAATGSVAPAPGRFYAPYFRAAAGVGLRWAITGPDRFNLRVDRAWGPNSAATYFTIGEAF